MKTVLVTGIGGLTPRSITGIIRENHPDYHVIGVDVNKKAVGFFMSTLFAQDARILPISHGLRN